MNRLSRYLFRNLATATLLSTLAVTAAIWVTQSLRLIDLVINAGAPFHVFLQLMLLTVPTFIGIVLPLALAGAVLFTYNKLTMDSELVVMRATGVGPLSLAAPALLLGLIVTLLVYAINLYASPWANRELVRLQYAVRHEYASVLIREGAFNQVAEGLTVYIRSRGADGALQGLLVHDRRKDGKEVTVMARHGLMGDAPGGIRLVMEDGVRQELETATNRFSELHFDRYVVDFLLESGDGEGRFADPRERSVAELLSPPEGPDLPVEMIRQFLAELHMRLSTPLLALAFAFIATAAVLLGEYNRRGQSQRIVVACVLVLVLQSSSLGLTGLASKNLGFVPVMYLAYLIPVLPAAWLMSRQ